MSDDLRVLIVDDSPADAELLELELLSGGYMPVWERVDTAAHMLEALRMSSWDLVLCDYSMPSFNGLEALEILKGTGKDIPFILISGDAAEDAALKAMRAGAHDFFLKGKLRLLVPAIRRELREAKHREDRNRAYQHLRESEERYRLLFDASPQPMWVADKTTGRFLAVNEATIRQYGYTREELLAMSAARLTPTPGRDSQHVTRDGTILDVALSAHDIVYDGVAATLVVATDVTARERAQHDLRRSEKRFRDMFNFAPVGIYQTSPSGKLLDANYALRWIIDLEEGVTGTVEAIGIPHEDLSRWRAAIESAGAITEERRIRRRDGTEMWVVNSAHAVKDAAGETLYYEGFIQDLTDRKLAEELLQARARRNEVLVRVSASAVSETDLAVVLHRTVVEACRALGVPFGAIFEWDAARARLVRRSAVGWPDDANGGALPVGASTPAGAALSSRSSIRITGEDSRFDSLEPLFGECQSAIVAVIPRNAEPYGVMCLGAPTAREFTDDEVQWVEGLANIVGAAADRMRIEDETRRQARRASAIADLGRAALTNDDPQALFEHACRLVSSTLDAPVVSILEKTGEGDGLRVIASVGLSAEVAGLIVPDGGGSQWGYTLRHNGPVVVADYANETRFAPAEIAAVGQLASAISTVIAGRSAPVGVLAAATTEPREFAEADVVFMNSMANVLGEALETIRMQQGLRRSGALLNMASRLARVGAWAVDLTSGHVTWSNEVCAVHDVPPGYVPTLTEAFAFYAPESRERISEAFDRCVRDGTPYDVEVVLITAKGRRVWARAIGEAERDANQVVRRVHGAIQDVSDSRQAAEETRLLAERLHATLESITDAFFRLDDEWRFTYVNDQAEKLFRRTREALLGCVIWSEIPELRELERGYRRAVAENAPVQFEQLYRGAWLEMRAYPSAEGLTVCARDVTSQHAARERIEEQAALLDEARDAIVVRDLSQRILFWNRGAERMFGQLASEAMGRRSDELLHADPDVYRVAMEALFRDGAWSGEIRLKNAAGAQLIVESGWTLLRDEHGLPRSILAIDTDITERKLLEQQFLRAQRMESIGTLAGGIAHDLNNLLMPIMMGAELLKRLDLRPESARAIRNIEEAAIRGRDLVRQVLSFARGIEGSRVTIAVQHIVGEIQAVLENTFPKGITVRINIPADTWGITADPTQIHQVLLNLCVNARDAMPNRGEISITARNVDVDEQYALMHRGLVARRYVRLEVSDTGSGIPQEILDRIFEPFFTTKDVGRGTGLGLSTVLAIVRSHEGLVTVYSETGKGTVFKVYLPATDELPADAAAGAVQQVLPRGNGELILVVDDESSILSVTQQTLEAFGYRVLTADDGAEAIGIYARKPGEVAAVITDMMMPVMDGAALIAALSRLDPGVRIIASSGLDFNDRVAKAANAGVKHFLQKPYSADVMLKTLRQILDEG